jgi:glutathione S-transferase
MVTLVGRSSSHFTRVARMFAVELGVEHELRVVPDLMTLDPAPYADNPALKIPTLIDEEGALFGAENVCRALARRSGRSGVVLRGDVGARIVANAEELVLHAMSAEVLLILAKATSTPAGPKVGASLENCLTWLDARHEEMLAALPPERSLSFVEVALFCLVTHLPWRNVLAIDRWVRLTTFARTFGERASAKATEYRFDAR